MSIESIVNQALDVIGYKRHITSIYDGSPAARIALNAWGETRDEVLEMQPWYFARDFDQLQLVQPNPPDPRWLYRFQRPAIAIRILDVFPHTMTQDDLLDPEPTRWLEVVDRAQASPQRGILTNFNPAHVAFTGRVVDWASWPPEFTQIVIHALAEKFDRALVGRPAAKEGEKR